MTFDTVLEIGRFVLGSLLVLANAAVWYGVWLERDSEPPEVQHRGWRILVAGLAAETTLGFILFGVDSAIAARQRAQLSEAQVTAANAVREAGQLGVKIETLPKFVEQREREIDGEISGFKTYAQRIQSETSAATAKLQEGEAALAKQVDAAASSSAASQKVASELKSELAEESQLRAKITAALAPWQISDAQLERIVVALRGFAGQKWEATAYWQMKSSMDLANRIYAALGKAQWVYVKPERGSVLFGGIEGVLVYSHPEASSQTRAAAAALVKALNAAGIEAVAHDKDAPGHPDELITLNVGSKPSPTLQ